VNARRHAHTLATPVLTRGDERPAPPCTVAYDQWAAERAEGSRKLWCYDVLIDPPKGGDVAGAIRQAQGLCGTCPVSCLQKNREEGWARLVLDITPDFVGDRRRTNNAERYARRHDLLVALTDARSPMSRILRWLGMTERQLYKWCHRYGHLDLWAAITPDKQPNQHRKGKVA